MLEPDYIRAAAEVSRQRNLAEPIPLLCTLVCASPFDAALHDAFGKLHGLNCYHTYGPDFCRTTSAITSAPSSRASRSTSTSAASRSRECRSITSSGRSTRSKRRDVKQPIGDGLPETLPEWIRFNGLTHLKIKLNGDDLGWDVERVLRIDSAAERTQHERGVSQWCYSLDFNERCPNVGYLLEFLRRVQERTPAGFERIAVHRAADGARPEGEPRQRHARGGEAAAGGHR